VSFNVRRGLKFGAMSAAFFPGILPINNYLRSDPTTWSEVLVGTLVAFVFFATIGSLTDKIGSDVGEA
jgi:hypothetical protein